MLLSIGSLLTVGFVLDEHTENQYWILLMPITWVVLLIVGICLFLGWGFSKTIAPFNDWLDSKNKEDDTGNV